MKWRAKTISLLAGVMVLALLAPVVEQPEHALPMGEIVLFTLIGCGYYVLVMVALPRILQSEVME